MLTILRLAATALIPLGAAAATYPYAVRLDATSPLITFSPPPVWIDPSSPTTNRTRPGTFSDYDLLPYLQQGWAIADYNPEERDASKRRDNIETEAIGSSFSVDVPAGARVYVDGSEKDVVVDVDVDGIPLRPPDVSLGRAQTSQGASWMVVDVGTASGEDSEAQLHTLTVTLRAGRMGVQEVRVESVQTSQSWIYTGYGAGIWGDTSGNWSYGLWNQNAMSRYLETNVSGAFLSSTLRPGTAFVEMTGYSNGSYAVRCVVYELVAAGPNDTPIATRTPTPKKGEPPATTYTGQHRPATVPVLLYAALLNPAQKYMLEFTSLGNTTAVMRVRAAEVDPDSSRATSSRHVKLGVGVGLGIGAGIIVLVVGGWLWCKRSKRRAGKHAIPIPDETGETDDDDDESRIATDCVVCRAVPPAYAVVECGHLCLCEACAEGLGKEAGERTCPVCRKAISEAPVRIFCP